MIAFLTYLGGISSALRGFFAATGMIGILAVIFFICIPNRMTDRGWKMVRSLLIIFLLMLFTYVVVPDNDTCMNIISELRMVQSCGNN